MRKTSHAFEPLLVAPSLLLIVGMATWVAGKGATQTSMTSWTVLFVGMLMSLLAVVWHHRFHQLDRSRYVEWALIPLVVLLVIPTLGDGFSTDDYFMLRTLERTYGVSSDWYDLYHFIPKLTPESIADGRSPWWSSTALRMHLLRPLSSALLTLDHCLFGNWAFGYRAHSLVWLSLLLVLVQRLYLRLFARPMGTFAFVLYAFSPCLVMPVLWISARHLLVAGVAVTAGLLNLVASPSQPRRRWFAATLFVVGLAASEAGLAGLAYWAAYEALARASNGTSARASRVALPLLVGGLYLVIYWLVGAGTRDCGLYIDPVGDPLGFLRVALQRIPALLGDAFLHVDAGMVMIWPVPVILLGLGAMALIAALSAKALPAANEKERDALSWLVAGACLTTLGSAGGPPGSRSLTIATVGFVPLTAILLRRGWTYFGTSLGPRKYGWQTLVALFALAQFVYGPLIALTFASAFRQVEPKTSAIEHQTARAAAHARQVILLAGSDFTVWYHAFGRLRPEGNAQGCWWVASAARGSHRITRTSPRSFSVELTDSELRRGPFELMWSGEQFHLPVGYEVSQCDATIRVAAVRDGNPYRLDIRLNTTLDDPQLALIAWQDGKIRRIAPQELEQGLVIRWSAGPMHIF